MRLARLVACACVLALLPPAAEAAAPSGMARQLTGALRSPYLSLGQTAALAISLDSGEVLYAHNETLPVLPASNEKLPVSWTALVRLGPAFRFHTDLLGSGMLRGSTWDGDLVLKGYGDPTLATEDLDRLAERVRTLGITRVTGRVRGDESFFDSKRTLPGWKHSYLGGETPPLSALVVDRATGWPALSPPLLAARALSAALAHHGVTVIGRPGLGRAPASATLIAADRSAPLQAVIRHMNHESDNFYAEMLLKQLGSLERAVGTSAAGAAIVTETLADAGIPLAGVRIVDGSGLSHLDRLTAAALVGIIRAGYHDGSIKSAFVNSLAVAGQSGTLSTRLLALRGVVRGKTGTTDLACTLSGVVGQFAAFAVLENGDPVSSWAARTAQDRFVQLLASRVG